MEVFISHITLEAPLASVLKKWIRTAFVESVEVFVSSDDSITPGEDWLDRIRDSLKSTKVLLAICSKESVHRPWINFEAGAGWIRGIPVIPLCHSGMTVGGLPQPLSPLQALDVEGDDFARRLMAAVAKGLGLTGGSPLSDYQEMEAEIQAALSKIAEESGENDDMQPDLKLVLGLDPHWAKQGRVQSHNGECTIYVGIQNGSKPFPDAASVELWVSEGVDTLFNPGRSERKLSHPFRYIKHHEMRYKGTDWHAAGYELAWEDIGLPRSLIRRVEPVRISNFSFKTNTAPIFLDKQRNIVPCKYHTGCLFWAIKTQGMDTQTGVVEVIRPGQGLQVSLKEGDSDFEIVDEA